MRCPSFTSVGGEKEAVRLRELRAAHGVRGVGKFPAAGAAAR